MLGYHWKEIHGVCEQFFQDRCTPKENEYDMGYPFVPKVDDAKEIEEYDIVI